ncbi:hypothetical protein ACHAWF_014397 [Thalassiosira exigua]
MTHDHDDHADHGDHDDHGDRRLRHRLRLRYHTASSACSTPRFRSRPRRPPPPPRISGVTLSIAYRLPPPLALASLSRFPSRARPVRSNGKGWTSNASSREQASGTEASAARSRSVVRRNLRERDDAKSLARRGRPPPRIASSPRASPRASGWVFGRGRIDNRPRTPTTAMGRGASAEVERDASGERGGSEDRGRARSEGRIDNQPRARAGNAWDFRQDPRLDPGDDGGGSPPPLFLRPRPSLCPPNPRCLGRSRRRRAVGRIGSGSGRDRRSERPSKGRGGKASRVARGARAGTGRRRAPRERGRNQTMEVDAEGGAVEGDEGSDRNDDDDDEEEEREHFAQVCRSYRQHATFHRARRRGVDSRALRTLDVADFAGGEDDDDDDAPKAERADGPTEGPTVASILPPSLTPGTSEHESRARRFHEATVRNQFFLDSALRYAGVETSQDALRRAREGADGGGGSSRNPKMEWATEDQMSKVDSVLKSLARDWSVEGLDERSAAYDRLLGALERHLPTTSDRNSSGLAPAPRTAVPGSGVGRLAWEVRKRGCSVEGSDFSLPMLLASDFVLNGCGANPEDAGGRRRQFRISPWIAETKNVASFEKRMRTVMVPDVDPTAIQLDEDEEDEEEAPEFTMMAGEFLSLYAHFLPQRPHSCNGRSHGHSDRSARKFDAVVCSFFLDTAPSLPHYLITIYHMLEEGGLLLHFGPLMYHWSGHGALLPEDLADGANDDAGTDAMGSRYRERNGHLDPRYLTSVDYDWEDVRQMVLNCGFDIEEEETNVPASYTVDEESMMRVQYNCTFLVARKRRQSKGVK